MTASICLENHGCGFRNLHQAMSTVTYENGGRTVLLCFRPTKESLEPASRLPALELVAVGNSPAVERSVPPGGKHGEAFKRAETTDLIPGGKMLPSTAGETPTHAGAGQLLAALDIASTTRTGGAKSEGT